MVEDVDTTIERNEVHLAVESQEPQSAIKVQIALKTSEKDEDELLKEAKTLFEFALDKSSNRKIKTKNNQLISLKSKNKELEMEKKQKDALYSKICEFISAFDVEQLRKRKDTIERLENRVDEFNVEMEKMESDHRSNQAKMKLLEGIPCGSSFPNCKFIRDANVSVANIPIIEKNMEDMNNKISEYKVELNALNSYCKRKLIHQPEVQR